MVQDLLPRPRRLCCRRCFSVCLLATLRKNVRTDLPEIFSEGWQWTSEQMITSSAAAAAKYCDEHVCVYDCVSVCLSACPGAYFRSNTRDFSPNFVHVAYGRGSVLLRQGEKIPRRRGNFEGKLNGAL